jgi:hypothetical protein
MEKQFLEIKFNKSKSIELRKQTIYWKSIQINIFTAAIKLC